MAEEPRSERDDQGQEHEGFLPPEPPGPEPDIGSGRRPAPPPPGQAPPGAFPTAPGQQSPPGQAPPAYGQQPWQPPPPPGWGAPQQPYPSPYPARPAEPDNGPAVAGFVLSMVAAGLLLFSAGLSTIISIGCAGFGIWYSLQGKRRVDSGETSKHRSLAQAGFITSIVALVLAVLATLFWLLILILLLADEDFQREFETTVQPSRGAAAVLTALGAARRLLA